MVIRPDNVDKKGLYQLLTSCVVPRPIALVMSKNEAGILNLAPFSFFNVVTPKPARISLVIGKRDGEYKDTARNIVKGKQFVVHVVTEAILEDAHVTSVSLPPEISEVDQTSFVTEFNEDFGVAHIKNSKVYFECELDQVVHFEDSDMVIGLIRKIVVDDEIMRDGVVDVRKLAPVARLSKDDYALLGKGITLKRPE